ncbi:MAG: hypothetical protein H6633_15315 [Anaerolineales bacterium]|nr:hypothetical protein [Anaerolineales bacterium]
MNKTKKTVEDYFYGSPVRIAEKILFIKRENRLGEYREYLTDVVEFGNVWKGITGVLRGERVSIIVTGIGPGLVGDAVYALNKPNAVCLYSGTCGGLKNGLKIGDYFLAEEAICADGISFLFGHENLSSVHSDKRAFSSVKATLNQLKVPFSEGLSFTTSSVVRENDANFWEFVSPQCLVIEMGCAAFYTAALHSHKRAVAYFWVSDLPTLGKSFFDPLSADEIAIKQARYEVAVKMDLSILSFL